MFKKNRFMVRIAALAVGAAMTAGLLGGCAGKKENESSRKCGRHTAEYSGRDSGCGGNGCHDL